MNERIYELAKQADLIEWDTLPSGARTPDHESVVKAKKFAETIVRECLDCIAKVHKTEYTKEFNEGYTLGVERCFYKIEEHFFGVEE